MIPNYHTERMFLFVKSGLIGASIFVLILNGIPENAPAPFIHIKWLGIVYCQAAALSLLIVNAFTIAMIWIVLWIEVMGEIRGETHD